MSIFSCTNFNDYNEYLSHNKFISEQISIFVPSYIGIITRDKTLYIKINDVTVDNGRLKFNVVDLDKVDLNGIKAIATSGVFVTGNIIKTLFKLDSQVIKQALEKNL